MNKFLEDNNLIKIHNNINDFIRNNKKLEFQCFNTRNKCYRIGVDAMLYAHKFRYSYDDIIFGFTNQIINFLSNRILPIYILDGLAPSEKSDVIRVRNEKKSRLEKRIEELESELNNEEDEEKKKAIKKKILHLKKSNIKITKEDLDNIADIAALFGVPCVRAKGEADVLIGQLYLNNSINACLSEDMDILIFGCRKMIKFNNKKIYEYDLDYILFKLSITYDQFLDMCILFGCDYLRPLSKLDTTYIYNNIVNKKLDKLICENVSQENYEKYLNEFKYTKDIFNNCIKNEDIKYTYFKIKSSINDNVLNQLTAKSPLLNSKKKNEFHENIFYINTLIRDQKFI